MGSPCIIGRLRLLLWGTRPLGYSSLRMVAVTSVTVAPGDWLYYVLRPLHYLLYVGLWREATRERSMRECASLNIPL